MFFRKQNIENNIQADPVEQLRQGSAEALQILFRKYNYRIYKFCLQMLNDENAAKDAMQETFIKIFENHSQFRGENFVSWMFTIARRNCLNQIRGRKEFESYDEFVHQDIREKENTSDHGLKEEIEKAIALLPISLKEALLLREYEECTYQEVADILGIEISLAKIRVHRARLLLRKYLEPIVREIDGNG